MRRKLRITLLLLLSSICSDVYAESCTHNDAMTPVAHYTAAMKEYRFSDAYSTLADTMTDGLPVEEWVEGQKRLFDIGQVVIGKLDVRWPQHINPSSCETEAIVPNVLSAKDRFNNQGSVEFELYRVSKVAGGWRIDSQETLFDEPAIHRWFPGHVIPDFQGQLLDDEPLPGE
ncbi:MAG: hypothetical protein ACI915_001575 [Gammaproteobacteria bacterium]|jgi:hypothetical protein